MQPEQKIIADWMERVMKAKGWTAADWARAADGIGATTTISRALKPDYDSITSVRVLHQLAVGANEPSVLDFLRGSDPKPAKTGIQLTAERLQQAVSEAFDEVQVGMSIAEIKRIACARLHALLESVQGQQSDQQAQKANRGASKASQSRPSTN